MHSEISTPWGLDPGLGGRCQAAAQDPGEHGEWAQQAHGMHPLAALCRAVLAAGCLQHSKKTTFQRRKNNFSLGNAFFLQ